MAACRFGPDSSLCLIGAPRRYAAPHYHARDPGPSPYNGVRMGDHTQQPGRADPRTPDGHPAARRVLMMPAQPRKDRANDAAPPKGGGLTAGPRRQPRRGRTWCCCCSSAAYQETGILAKKSVRQRIQPAHGAVLHGRCRRSQPEPIPHHRHLRVAAGCKPRERRAALAHKCRLAARPNKRNTLQKITVKAIIIRAATAVRIAAAGSPAARNVRLPK